MFGTYNSVSDKTYLEVPLLLLFIHSRLYFVPQFRDYEKAFGVPTEFCEWITIKHNLGGVLDLNKTYSFVRNLGVTH